MSPSSLIFVAVVAVWAAYLVVDTGRRREYLATAQSVERFSASMRVLQRRAIRRETAEAFEASTAPMRSTSSVLLHRPPSRASIEAKAAQAAAPAPAVAAGGPRGLAARQQRRAQIRRARLMGVAALAVAVLSVISVVLAALGLVGWALPAAGVLGVAGLIVLMRRQAVSARSAERPVARTGGATSVAAVAAQAEQRTVAEDDLRPAATAMPVAQEYVPFDYAREIEPIIRAEREVVAAEHAADPLMGEAGWQPVFVPPPTYTLKARAEHPLPAPIEIEQPVYEEWYEEETLDYGTYGRASGQ